MLSAPESLHPLTSNDDVSARPLEFMFETLLGGARFDKQFAKHLYFVPSYTWIGWNNDHPIFSDTRVPQACQQALDLLLECCNARFEPTEVIFRLTVMVQTD